MDFIVATRERKPGLSSACAIVAAGLALSACLPDDTRPAPGQAVLTIAADEHATHGMQTRDGWQIRYERFLLSLGEVRLLSEDCEPYAEADYLRVLDMRRPGAQTVNTSHAIGRCELGFQLRSPAENSVLGAGVSEVDRVFMRERGSDAFGANAGRALHVAGSATRDAVTMRFAWSFRQRLDYLCDVVAFESGTQQHLEIDVRGGALFRAASADTDEDREVELELDAYAAADGDGDGDITLAELDGAQTASGDRSLAAELYLERVPELLRFAGQRCFVARLPEE
jgi:hypothetical protein